jgi:hypothetical protein
MPTGSQDWPTRRASSRTGDGNTMGVVLTGRSATDRPTNLSVRSRLAAISRLQYLPETNRSSVSEKGDRPSKLKSYPAPCGSRGAGQLEATDPLGLNWNYQNNTACAPLPGTQVFQGVPYVCANGGSEGEVQSVGVTATPLPGPPSWIPANLTGVPYCAANPLACTGPTAHPTGPGGGGGGGGGTAPSAAPILTVGPSTATPWYRDSCITSAIGTGALKAGVDAIGLLPEAGGVARIIGHQAGYVGVVADQFGANVIGAVGHTGTAVDGLVNAGNTTPQGLLSTSLTVAGFIPGVSDAAAVLSISLDVISTIQAVGACP